MKVRNSNLTTFQIKIYLITSIVNAQGNMSYVVEFPCANAVIKIQDYESTSFPVKL